MTKLGWKRWIVILAFLAVVSFTGYFVVRTTQRAIYWHYHKDETIRPWMSVSYVAHSYHVPPQVLYQALGLQPRPRDKKPIREIAREQNRSVDDVIADLRAAIVRARPPNPPPPGPDEGKPR